MREANRWSRQDIERAQHGDHEAFSRLVHALEGAVNRVVRSVRQLEEPEDVTQEIWWRLYRFLPTFDLDRTDRLEAWAMRLARNVCFDRRRKGSVLTLSFGEDGDSDPFEAPGGTPLGELVHDEAYAKLEREVQSLPDNYRRSLEGRVLGRSYEELASDQGISVANARTRVGRARRLLRERIGRFHAA